MMDEAQFVEDLLAECTFVAARSSGKGGQNVNKVSTKVILSFDVPNSKVLTAGQKELVQVNLGSRLTLAGVLLLNSSSERSQLMNKKRVRLKFVQLISKALLIPPGRIGTQLPEGARQRRAKAKKHQSAKKLLRGGPSDEDINF